jgi:hypothetical protein
MRLEQPLRGQYRSSGAADAQALRFRGPLGFFNFKAIFAVDSLYLQRAKIFG